MTEMHVVTSEQMKKLDEETINGHEPGLVLMERAGTGIFESVLDIAGEPESQHAGIFLGRGNNAGDGLVVARLLAEAGAGVTLFYMHSPSDFSPDALENHGRLSGLLKAGKIEEFPLDLPEGLAKAREKLEGCTVIIDALLGTGINSPVRENYALVIGMINSSGIPVVSVDIPSGINGTTGEVMGVAVMADLTVTMALPKTGSVFYPGKAYSGSLDIVDIGIPDEVLEASGIDSHIFDMYEIARELPLRSPESHKFACGSLLLIAGSRRYSGAAYLSAVSALRTGCGIVYLAGPESIRTVIQASAPEIIFISLPETDAGSIGGPAGWNSFEGLRFDAVAAGPGLTTDRDTVRFVREIVENCEVPLLLDADGLNAFENGLGDLADRSREIEMLISPHSGELARLTGMNVPARPPERIESLRALVEGTGMTLVHKGAPTVIAHPDGRIDVNVFGHPGMATAGSGDVLTGAIGGIMAQGAGCASAARIGVYVHSRAAEIAAADTGQRGMTAGDCCDALPAAVKEIEETLYFLE